MSIETYKCPGCGQIHYGRTYLKKQPDRLCEQCHNAKSPGKFDSTHSVRCPRCGMCDDELGELEIYDEGTHSVTCGHCDCDYEVQTVVTYDFRSPARESKPEPGETMPDELPFSETKPKCPVDDSHGVVPVRTQGTFTHHWTCLSCNKKFCRAPDRDPNIPESFTIGEP